MLKPIVMSFIQNDGYILNHTSAYEITFSRWPWLGRLCWNIMNKLGCVTPHFDKQCVVKQVRIDPSQAALKIVRLACDQLNMLGKRPERILLGRQQFADIACGVDYQRPFEFEIELQEPTKYLPEDEWSQYRTRNRLFNVPVSVIPWMDGVLVL